MASWKMSSTYDVDDDRNISLDVIEEAIDSGDLEELTNGDLYCPYSGELYWFDGTKKE